MPSRDTNIGAKRAREFRDELGLTPDEPIGCVLSLAEERAGVPVVLARLGGDVSGAIVPAGDPAIVFVNGGEAAVRQRFTLAHELGHLRCGHLDASTPIVDTPTEMYGKELRPTEIQANAFAAELLAPAAHVREAFGIDPDLLGVARLAAWSGLSMIAASFRFRTIWHFSSDDRAARLRAEVDDEELRRRAWAEAGVEPIDDLLGSELALPRFSPAIEGSTLAGIIDGTTSLDDAAAAAGVPAEALAVQVAGLVPLT